MLSKAELDNMFTYHPPRTDQVGAYRGVVTGFANAVDEFEAAHRDALAANGNNPDAAPARFQRVTHAARQFVEAIDCNAPDGRSKTAAIEHIRRARNAMNDALFVIAGKVARLQVDYYALALEQLLLAKYAANTAIACEETAQT